MPRNEIRLQYTMMQSEDAETAEILVYGAITDYKWSEDDPEVTAKDFDKMLKDARANGAKKLNLRINSGGGAVYQAVAMRTMLMTSSFDEINVNIEGLCASAATLLCCIPNANVAIADGSEFMIHNPSVLAVGTASDLEKTAERMHKMENDFHAVYAQRTGKSEEEIEDMMDAETWMTAREAVENGFCDNIIEVPDGTYYACGESNFAAMRAMYHNMPENFAAVRKAEDDSNATDEIIEDASVYNNTEEETVMEIRELTMEQLQAENPALYESVMAAGAVAERERISEIDDLTPAGYEQMAAEAKANGTSAMNYHKAIVKAQREKGKAFIENRKTETAPAAEVSGGAAEDTVKTDDDAMDKAAKEIAEYAKQMRVGNDTMF